MKLVALLIPLIVVALAAPAAHEVTQLKGYYDFAQEFQMYSGYLTIQKTPLISVHYLFITSKNQPETDDLVVWSNGGPGCSSLIGFLTEIGPQIVFQGSDKLSPESNSHSWNNNANILFFESPPGVGFSINQDKAYEFNDTRSAQDNMAAIVEWFKLFPEYSNNRFWISGESYCGMYLPLLADQLLKNKDSILPDGKELNFTGMIIGNGVMVTELHWRRQARNTFFAKHSHLGPEVLSLISNCKYNDEDDKNLLCRMGNKLVDQDTLRINPYNSIGICYDSRLEGKEKRRYWYSAFDEEMYAQKHEGDGGEKACSSDTTGPSLFFNDVTVQKQLHVKAMNWEECSDRVGSTFKKDLTTIPLFEGFKEAGLSIMLFSGNVDAQVSYIETEEYIKLIGWNETTPKHSVLNPLGSLEGWITQYDGLTFYVINAAGHMVPHDKPAAASKMFDWFRSQN